VINATRWCSGPDRHRWRIADMFAAVGSSSSVHGIFAFFSLLVGVCAGRGWLDRGPAALGGSWGGDDVASNARLT